MFKRIGIIAILILAFTTSAMAADAVPADKVADLIQKRYETMKNLTADVVQELTNVASGQVDVRKGKIWFQQPSLVRWETYKPEAEILVVGPEVAWDYIKEDEIAFKYSVAGLLDSKTMLRFISGKANLKEDFVIKSEWKGAAEVRKKWGKGLTILQLTPKEPEPGMVLAYIGVDPKTAVLKQIMVVDFYGNGNEIKLSNIKHDVEIKTEMFVFTPPKGVTIEDNTAAY